MTHRAKVILLRLALVFVVVSSSQRADQGWQRREIDLVEVRGSTLVVGGHCHGDARVRVDEGPEEVVLTLEVDGEPRGECHDTVQAELDGAVDGRRLVDSTTGAPAPRGRHDGAG